MRSKNLNLHHVTVDVDEDSFEGLLQLTDKKPKGLIVFTHGFNTFGCWGVLFPVQRLVKNGYAVLMPSQAGFGFSSLPRDFCGPRTVNGISNLIKEVKSEFEILENCKVGLLGISRGAIVSALITANNPRLVDALIVQAGAYDHKASYEWEDGIEGIKENMRVEGGVTEKDFLDRSILHRPEDIKVPVLIIHGELDDRIPVSQAENFFDALQNAGKDVQLEVIADAPHRVSSPENTRKFVLPFLEKNLS